MYGVIEENRIAKDIAIFLDDKDLEDLVNLKTIYSVLWIYPWVKQDHRNYNKKNEYFRLYLGNNNKPKKLAIRNHLNRYELNLNDNEVKLLNENKEYGFEILDYSISFIHEDIINPNSQYMKMFIDSKLKTNRVFDLV